jgi:putative chitinase
MLGIGQLHKIYPRLPLQRAEEYLEPLNQMLQENAIDTAVREAAFLGQVAVESREMTQLEENLDYSATRLLQVFPKYFRTADAAIEYAHQPEKLANFVYGSRLGNGPASSSDGWRYRGRGLLQLTGRTHYVEWSQQLGLDLENSPDLLIQPAVAFAQAGRYWTIEGLNALADQRDFKGITRVINSGCDDLDRRIAYTQRALSVLGSNEGAVG